MTWIHPVWLENQRQRFTRPDAYRWRRPDEVGDDAPSDLRKYRRLDEPAHGIATVSAESEGLDARRLALARLRLDWELLKLALGRKAGFNPNQLRVPAGNPDGGQWTSESDDDIGRREEIDETSANSGALHTDFSDSRRDRANGHHYVPRQLFKNTELSDEARQVFEGAKTGRLYDMRSNKNDFEHRAYNTAVTKLFDRFLNLNGISRGTMTEAHARQFVQEVQQSRDPAIRNFNLRIHLREIMHRVLTRTRANE